MATWSIPLFETERAAIGARLAALPDSRERLRQVLAGIRQLEDDDSDSARLRRYIQVVFALIEHQRSGGLSPRDVEQLIELAYAILRTQGVVPKKSRLARFYGDLHLIRSQIYRGDGLPFEAAWEQQLAVHYAGAHPGGGHAFQVMVTASRYLRLGHVRLALAQFDEALGAGLNARDERRTRLQRGLALVLLGSRDIARENLAPLVAADAEDSVGKEAAWQLLVISAIDSGDLSPLIAQTRRNRAHHEPGYIVEACMWTFAGAQRELIERLPSLDYLRRRKKEMRALGLWYELSHALQACYDAGLPLSLRINQLARCLKRRQELITIDKELVMWAAAWRWLLRSHANGMAMLALAEYQALCRRVSDGANPDVLGLCGRASD